MIEEVDAFYSANLSQEVRRGQRKVAERGYYPGNKAPYGYRLEKVQEEEGNAFHNIFVIDPNAASLVRRIFDEAMAGRTYTDIREGLNRDHVPPPEKQEGRQIREVVRLHDLRPPPQHTLRRVHPLGRELGKRRPARRRKGPPRTHRIRGRIQPCWPGHGQQGPQSHPPPADRQRLYVEPNPPVLALRREFDRPAEQAPDIPLLPMTDPSPRRCRGL